MASITVQKPTDQPLGRGRLLESLRLLLGSRDLNEFYMVVAFAKVGPLLRLRADIEAWRAAGKSIHAVIGVDEQGTSVEALQFAIDHFSGTHVAHVPGPFTPTFHPKIYAFRGPTQAVAFLGSNNLTVGGLESNFESHLRVQMNLPADDATWADFDACYRDALTAALPLTPALLQQLSTAAIVVGEAAMRATRQRTPRAPGVGPAAPPALPAFPMLPLVPPSPLPAPRAPRPARVAQRAAPARRQPAAPAAPAAPLVAPAPQAIVMQIAPHHNGEIFLSKMAIDQDPAFFGWPFTGQTVPKRPGNPPYPQRVPDPVVDLRIFDAAGQQTNRLFPFNLNTVFYDKKSEIRITVSPEITAHIPQYSIMVMRQSDRCDYEIEVYAPGSPDYQRYLASCNQTMPSGGKANPRRFGWI